MAERDSMQGRGRRQAGFTLVEIMIAVAILAVITAIAIPLYQGYVVEARIGAAIKDIHQAEVILNDLALEGDLDTIDGGTTTELGLYLRNGVLELAATGSTPAGTQPWLDPWDRIYRYKRPPTRTDAGGTVSNNSTSPQGYDLYSQGPDTGDAGDDVIRGCNGEFTGEAAGHNC